MAPPSLKAEFSSYIYQASPHGTVVLLWTLAETLAHEIRRWRDRAETRRALRDLDAHLLKDVGLTRAQALNEAAKPFWKR